MEFGYRAEEDNWIRAQEKITKRESNRHFKGRDWSTFGEKEKGGKKEKIFINRTSAKKKKREIITHES